MANSLPAPVICWFRQDLRLADNPAWSAACAAAIAEGAPVLPVYILDDINADTWKMGGASRVWLHHSLTALNKELQERLCLLKGRGEDELIRLIEQTGARQIFWNRCYEPWRIKRDTQIKQQLTERGLTVESSNGSLLWEPWQIKKQDGTPYKVFTPFYRKGCLGATPPRLPLPAPKNPPLANLPANSVRIEALQLLPRTPRWDKGMMSHWTAGEAGAWKKLETFLGNGLSGYKEGRNFPSKQHTSGLSPHLHFGEISPNQVWYAAQAALTSDHTLTNDVDCFLSELGWREFAHHLLTTHPDLPENPLDRKFTAFPWNEPDDNLLEKWKKGRTGFPIVDAGMRELWETGYMHNRVRMVVASFLVKNMRIHWKIGEDWFWETLVDADLANNAASWQWVAGCGADAAPYFRIFNPASQQEKFDPGLEYVKKWAPDSISIRPILDLGRTRADALAAYQSIKQ